MISVEAFPIVGTVPQVSVNISIPLFHVLSPFAIVNISHIPISNTNLLHDFYICRIMQLPRRTVKLVRLRNISKQSHIIHKSMTVLLTFVLSRKSSFDRNFPCFAASTRLGSLISHTFNTVQCRHQFPIYDLKTVCLCAVKVVSA